MARQLRIEYPGALYHITSRGNAKQAIFLDDEDRSMFIRILAKVVKEYEWKCYSYCLMSNHYHLLIETPKANLSRGMQLLNGTYAQKYNERHNKVGHLLQGRFHSVIVDKEEYLLEVCRYIVLNPARAGIVDDPRQYRWSSYRDTVGERKAAPFLDISYVLSLFSQPGRNSVHEYRDFVLAGIGIDIWTHLRGGLILGGEQFSKVVQERIGDMDIGKGLRRSELFAGRPGLSTILGDEHASKDERNKRILEAYVDHGYSQVEIAEYLHFHRCSISKIISSLSKEKPQFEL
jgi:putative transposase